MLVGDINLPGINWANGTSTAKGRNFLDTVESKFMTQHVNFATHTSGNTLDLFFSSSESMVGQVRSEGRLGSSDHDIISFITEVELRESKNETNGAFFTFLLVAIVCFIFLFYRPD